jgi:hypothetical protein
MSRKKLADLDPTALDWAAIDNHLAQLNQLLEPLVYVPAEHKARVPKMGPLTSEFCRKGLMAMELEPELLPASLSVPEIRSKLELRDQLNVRLITLTLIFYRFRDTEFALGSDVLSDVLHGYRLLKAAGKHSGNDIKHYDLGSTFKRASRKRATAPSDT